MTSAPRQGVVAVIRDEAERYLFIRRGLTLARAPGVWCFVGGEIEPGESPHQAVVREVWEEVGLTVRAGEKVHESLSPNGLFLLHWLEVSRMDSNREIKPHHLEVAEFTWAHVGESQALSPMLPTLRRWLEDFNL